MIQFVLEFYVMTNTEIKGEDINNSLIIKDNLLYIMYKIFSVNILHIRLLIANLLVITSDDTV